MPELLIVEDEAIIAAQLKRRLEADGCQVLEPVATGAAAVESARQNRPDLVLMDIVLPGDMNGIEAAEQIQKDLQIPVVFITAQNDEEFSAKAVNVRPLGFLIKPFRPGEVETVVRIALEQSEILKKLRESEERFQAIFQSVEDSIFIKNLNLEYVHVNRAMEKLFGKPREELIGKIDEDLFGPEAAGEIREMDLEVLKGKTIENEHTKPVNGEQRTFHTIKSPMYESTGGVTGLCGIARDVTPRKKTEEALRESEKRYRQITNAVTDYIYTVRVENGQAVESFHSPACEAVTGYSVTEFAQDPYLWIKMIPEEDQDMATRQAEGILSSKKGYVIEHRIIRKDGEMRWIRNTPVLHFEQNGELVSYDGLIRDVTEQKDYELALQDNQERFRAIADYTYDWESWFGTDGSLLWVNPAVERFTGYTPSECVYMHDFPFVLVDEKDRSRFQKLMLRSLDKKTSVDNVPFRITDRNERLRWMAASWQPIYDSGGAYAGLRASFRDISELKRTEEERQKLHDRIQQTQRLESLGILAGGIAHDFNNLLMGIMGSAELADMNVNDSEQVKEYMARIVSSGHRAADLCRQLLAYAGQGKYVVEQVDLRRVILGMSELIKSTVSKKVNVTYDLSEDLPLIDADASQLRQVLLNVITNASEAIGEKNGVVAVKAKEKYFSEDELHDFIGVENASPGGYVTLEVADSGCGMDKAVRERIFEPFFTTKFTGRGLGLSAALGIVRNHHGGLKVESTPERGTTVTLIFSALNTKTDIKHPRPGADPSWQGRGTVLLAEDEETVLAVASDLLASLGFKVIAASDGCEAVELYRHHVDDVVLAVLDTTMPYMGGVEALSEIRKINQDLPVLLSSGYVHENLPPEFSAASGVAFIHKPYRLEVLRSQVKSILKSD